MSTRSSVRDTRPDARFAAQGGSAASLKRPNVQRVVGDPAKAGASAAATGSASAGPATRPAPATSLDQAISDRLRTRGTASAALLLLHGRETATPGELARELSLSPFRATCLANRLAADGHVHWGVNPLDRRGIAVGLSPRTRRALESLVDGYRNDVAVPAAA